MTKRIRRPGARGARPSRPGPRRADTYRNRYERAIEASDSGIWEWDLRGKRYFRSPRLCELLGFKPREFPRTRTAVLERIHPEDRPSVEAGLRAALEGRAPYRIEYRIRCKDGRYRWFAASGAVERDAKGSPVRFIGWMTDVDARRRAEEALRASEDRFRRLTELSSDWYWEQDERFRFTFTSGAQGKKTGLPASDIAGKTRWEIPAPNMTDADWARHRALVESHQPFKELELQRVYASGIEYWVSVSGEPVFDADGRFSGYRGTARDITRRKLAEERLRATLEGTPDVAIQWYDSDFRVVYWNPASERLYGIAREEALGKAPDELAPFDAASALALRDAIAESGATGRAFGPAEFSYIRRDSTQGIVQATVFAIPTTEGGPKFVCMAVDVTERKLAERRLAHLAQHDTLTGLPNRTLFRDRLLQSLAQATRNGWKVGVMFIDLDHFKVVNDTLGHNSGDRLLRAIARRLHGAIRAGDTIARLGGDEFAVILPDMRHDGTAAHVAQKLLDVLAEPVHVDSREMFIGGSIGITVAPTDGNDPDILLRNADTAMYRAKDHGRGVYQFFAPSMNERAQRALELDQSLRRALERGEFRLYYEPRVDAKSGAVAGVEALLRWATPGGSIVLPSEFIAVLEETGRIVPVSEWVLREACAQLVSWQGMGLGPLAMSVNVSARQFRHGEIVAAVKDALAATGARASDLELELTEGTLMQDTDASRAALAELKALGVRVAVDDFGTGYSSLAYLKRFAIDAVKIDRSFVRDIPEDPNDSAIVTAIVAMAHTLGLRVVAEGVELKAQSAFLVACGCDELQGYLISRPRPAAEMEAFLRGGPTVAAA